MTINKKLRETIPSELVEAVRKLNNQPKSIRLAGELYETGLTLLKQNGIYIPLLPYRAELSYIPIDNMGLALVNFQRYWNFGCDKIQAGIFSPRENIGVEVVRERGAEVYKNQKANPLSALFYENVLDYIRANLKKTPSRTGIFKFTEDHKVKQITCYDLLDENPPIIINYL